MKQKLAALAILVATWLLLWQFFPMRNIVQVETSTPDPLGEDLVRELSARFGPEKSSMGPEEWILRELLGDRRQGFFVDVGAADARRLSNTYYLESALGWSGLAIEPQTSFAEDYARYRPRTRFLPFLVSAVSDSKLPFYIAGDRTKSSTNRDFAAGGTRGNQQVREVTVSTITLDDLLAREKVDRIDLLTMDIEGHEPEALKAFDIARWRPGLVCMEAVANRQFILDYFARHQYALQERYLFADRMNFYFIPVPSR